MQLSTAMPGCWAHRSHVVGGSEDEEGGAPAGSRALQTHNLSRVNSVHTENRVPVVLYGRCSRVLMSIFLLVAENEASFFFFAGFHFLLGMATFTSRCATVFMKIHARIYKP